MSKLEQYRSKLKEFITANEQFDAKFRVMKQEISLLKKQNKELEQELLEIGKNMSLQRNVSTNDMEEKMRFLVRENDELIKLNKNLTADNNKLISQNKSLSDQVKQLLGQLSDKPGRSDVTDSWED